MTQQSRDFLKWANDNQGVLALIALIFTMAGALWKWIRKSGHLPVAEVGPTVLLDRNYLKQMERHFLELHRTPLVHSDEEILALQADLIEPYYKILETAAESESNTDRGAMTSDLVKFLLKSDVPMVVKGNPGGGKSVSLQRVGMSLAKEGQRSAEPQLPVYLRLGTFTERVLNPREDALQFVKRSLQNLGGQAEAVLEHFNEYLLKGRFVFLFDGMDEMPRLDYDKRFEALAELRQYSANKFLFACRTMDFRESFPFKRAVIQPFQPRQIRQFLKRTLGAEGRDASRVILSRENPLRDMAGNPFFLKLLSVFYKNQHRVPDSRAELMREYEVQVFKRARLRQTFPPVLELSVFHIILARLGYLIATSERGVTLPREQLIGIFEGGEGMEREMLAKAAPFVDDAITVAVDENMVRVDTEADRKGDYEVLSFYHHRLQEYYAAVYLAEFSPHVDWSANYDDIWWQEILVMLCGITTQPEKYVQPLTESVPGTPLTCQEVGKALFEAFRGVTTAKTDTFDPDKAIPEAVQCLEKLDSFGFYGLPRKMGTDREYIRAFAERFGYSLPDNPTESGNGSSPFAKLSNLSPEPDTDPRAETLRRCLESGNRVVLDRAELAAECLRNSRGDRSAAPEGFTSRLSTLAGGGNSWEAVRAINIASRLREVDLFNVVSPALFQGTAWSRRAAMEAISAFPVGDAKYLDHAAFIIVLQFLKGELIYSAPLLGRSILERPRLALFLPGVGLLAALSIVRMLSPVLLYMTLKWRYPAGFLPSVVPLNTQDSAMIGAAMGAAYTYFLSYRRGQPVLRTTLVLCGLVLVPHAFQMLASWVPDVQGSGELGFLKQILAVGLAGITGSVMLTLPLAVELVLANLVGVICATLFLSTQSPRASWAYARSLLSSDDGFDQALIFTPIIAFVVVALLTLGFVVMSLIIWTIAFGLQYAWQKAISKLVLLLWSAVQWLAGIVQLHWMILAPVIISITWMAGKRRLRRKPFAWLLGAECALLLSITCFHAFVRYVVRPVEYVLESIRAWTVANIFAPIWNLLLSPLVSLIWNTILTPMWVFLVTHSQWLVLPTVLLIGWLLWAKLFYPMLRDLTLMFLLLFGRRCVRALPRGLRARVMIWIERAEQRTGWQWLLMEIDAREQGSAASRFERYREALRFAPRWARTWYYHRMRDTYREMRQERAANLPSDEIRRS